MELINTLQWRVGNLLLAMVPPLCTHTHTHYTHTHTTHTLTDDTIDESYGVAVVFHEEEEGEGGRGETMVAQDEGEEEEEGEEGGVEADYEGVLHADVRTQLFY